MNQNSKYILDKKIIYIIIECIIGIIYPKTSKTNLKVSNKTALRNV